MNRQKRKFTYPERYAVWDSNKRKCWWCKEPLRLAEATVDHVLPESLLDDEAALQQVLEEYGLPRDFAINGYENWLPCHNHCNQSKGSKTFPFIPALKAVLDGLRERASKALITAQSVISNVSKDKVFKTVFAALEKRQISVLDLHDLLRGFLDDPTVAGVPPDVIILGNGFWVPREEIASEGLCRCELNTCVGAKEKVYCYFEASLSHWVVKKGLFWRCYDEITSCPRCQNRHKRGHIGRLQFCGRPYQNQEAQTD
ncbi:MAG TPA: hypothetical protein VG796_14225 [Verrucomicrobiales bacterium]|nr:hypothetical protein [Verrucomicrobiales bacterium]